MAAPTVSGSSLAVGWGGGTSHTISTINFGSSIANAVYCLSITICSPSNSPINVSSITDSEGNTWKLYKAISGVGFTKNLTATRAGSCELWYCVAPSSGATPSVTVNFNGTIDSAVATIFRYAGCYTPRPFDRNFSLPGTEVYNNPTTSAAMSVSGLSTTQANVRVIQVNGSIGSSQSTGIGHVFNSTFADASSGTGFANVNQSGNSQGSAASAAALSSFTSDTNTTLLNNGFFIVAALTSDTQPAFSVKHRFRLVG